MENADHDTVAWSRSKAHPLDRDSAEDWPVTRVLAGANNPFARDRDEPDETPGDIGRQTVPNEHELFVSCDPGPALQQQFEFLRPKFIAVHDIGTSSSRKLLIGIASAGGRPVQRLVIRRQGYGTALATLHFVELPTIEGPPLRMYTTDCETESGWRADIARLLLAFSRLGVVMVGDLQPLAIGPALRPLRESMTSGPWPNRHLLLLPLSSANNLVSHGMELARGTGVNVRTTPQVARPADAWGFISGTWGRANEKSTNEPSTVALSPLFANGRRSALPPNAARQAVASPRADHSESPDTTPGMLALAGRPVDRGRERRPSQAHAIVGTAADRMMPGGARAAALAPDMVDRVRRYVRQVSEIAGVGSCCVFEIASGDSIAYAGAGLGAAALAAQGAELVSGMVGPASKLILGNALSEAAITMGMHHLLLRAMPRHAKLGLIAVLERASANLTMVRLQVLRLDAQFEEPVQ
jgi:hypothetical protein